MTDQSIIQRAIAGVKYAITGVAPTAWFGPLQPLSPLAPPEVAGRQWDYPVGANLNYRPRSGDKVGFEKLKALATNCDQLRIVIERQKDKLETLEWSIRPRDVPGKRPETPGADCFAIQAQLEYPDRIHDWGQWVRGLLDQNFVLDALSIYRQRDRGGKPYAFELIDGATIKPLLDQSGRRPASPDPAYQQILKGIPAVDYTTEELLYFPQNFRPDSAYGYSRVEWILNYVETAIERLKSQKGFFTHGNLSDGFFSAPDGVQPDQVRQVETMWNNLLAGTPIENRRQNQFLPSGFTWNAIGQPPLQEAFDEWLARIVCFPFGEAPTPFLKQQGLGHGSAQTEHGAGQAAGFGNTMGYVRRVVNRLLVEDFKRPDLEFAWTEDREFDPNIADEIQSRRYRDGRLFLNEARDQIGLTPVDGGDQPMVITATGAALLDDVLNPPEPEPEPDALSAAPPGGGEPQSKLAKAAPSIPERRLAAALNRYLATKGKEIAAALGESLGLAKADDPSDDYDHQINHAFEALDWSWSDLPAAVKPLLTGIATVAGKQALGEFKLFDSATLAKMTENATDWAEGRAAELVGMKLVDGELVDNPGWSIPSATRDMIRSAVTQAMSDGASNAELAAAVRESGAFSKSRAMTIARTETGRADTEGARAGWRASGLVAGREWEASADCCDECAALDGTIVGIDEDFPDGAVAGALHPNCECDELPVLPEDMPDAGDGEADD